MKYLDLYYVLSIAIYCILLYRVKGGLVSSESWVSLVLAFSFSQSVFGYLFAILGDTAFAWIPSYPATRLHNELLLIAMLAAVTGHYITRRFVPPSKVEPLLNPLIFNESFLKPAYTVFAISGIFGVAFLSIKGYFGYYVHYTYLGEPPWWLDLTRNWINLAALALFILQVHSFKTRGSLGKLEAVLTVAWLIVGVLTGFKSLVIKPILTLVVGAWLVRKHKWIHFLVLGLSIAFSYTIIEPLRVEKQSNPDITIAHGLWNVLFENRNQTKADTRTIPQKFIQRFDLSATGINVLDSHEKGRLKTYKTRLDEYFKLWPILAVVPRAFWEDKPLANLGVVLFEDLYRRRSSSLAPSLLVTTYIYGGHLGVVTIYFVFGMLLTLGGHFILRSTSNFILFSPWLVYGFTLSIASDIMAEYYIFVLRGTILIAILFSLGFLNTRRDLKQGYSRN